MGPAYLAPTHGFGQCKFGSAYFATPTDRLPKKEAFRKEKAAKAKEPISHSSLVRSLFEKEEIWISDFWSAVKGK
jgi:hypothetical protein